MIFMGSLSIVDNTEDFNNIINKNDHNLYVCFLTADYGFNEEYTNNIIEIFDVFDIVSGVYSDIYGNIMSFPPFAPNKYYSSFILNTPLIVRSTIGEYMNNDSYQEYFEKTRYNKMYYHIPLPIFSKK